MNLSLSNPLWPWVCLAIATIYLFIWPSTLVPSHPGPVAVVVRFVLRWLHPITWLLLAASFFIRSGMAKGRSGTANVIALMALLSYLVFIATVISQRISRH